MRGNPEPRHEQPDLRSRGVLPRPPLTRLPAPVWPFHPLPIDLGEVRKLSEISDRYLAAYSEGVREPSLVPTTVLSTPDTDGLSHLRPGFVLPVRKEDRVSDSLLLLDPLRVCGEVLRPSEELRCRLLDANDRVLATWQGSKDELDVFVAVVHVQLLRLLKGALM